MVRCVESVTWLVWREARSTAYHLRVMWCEMGLGHVEGATWQVRREARSTVQHSRVM